MIKNKIVVGIIPVYNLKNEENDPYLDRAYFVRMYEEMIVNSGGIPIGLLDSNMDMYKDICDAYVWPGGYYVRREYYSILDDAIKNHKPVLGICLGMQALSIYINVLEDMKNNKDKTLEEVYQLNKESNPYLKRIDDSIINNHLHEVTKDEKSINNAKHDINIKENSFMYDIYKTNKLSVVSLHSSTVNRLTDNVLVSALSDDNIIEAIEYHDNNSYILGVQFHPEVIKDHKIFDWLVDMAKGNLK